MALEMDRIRLDEEMARLGKALVARLFVLIKTSQNYREGHSALEVPVANVLKVVQEILRRNEEASLRVKDGYLSVGELRLKLDAAGYEVGQFVMMEMKRHRMGGICFSMAVKGDELCRFVYALAEADAEPAEDPYGRMLDRMQRRLIVNIQVEALPRAVRLVESDREKLQDGKLKARLLYKKAVSAMEEVMESARLGQPLRLRETKRTVQHMIDLLDSHQSSLLGAASARCHDAYTQNHAANVCVLSLVMGRRIRMSKFELCELGMAALFHDIGKAEIPQEILDKPGELSPRELQLLEAHPINGVVKMMKLKGLDAMSSRIMTGIFEHHLLADYSGYPRLSYRRLGLFGRIISVADCYDGLIASRVSGRTSHPPDMALRIMLRQGGRAYDPGLLKLLIGCVGMHGAGSLLLLDSRELAVVVGNHPDPARCETPIVKIIADSSGGELDGDVVDLARCEPPRAIMASLEPHLYCLDVSRYFL